MTNEELKIQKWLDAIEDPLIILDDSGRVLRTNSQWRKFCTEQQLHSNLYEPGENFFGEFIRKGRTREMETVQRIAKGELEADAQMYPLSLPDGDIQWFSAKVKHIALPGDQGSGAILFMRPVTLDTVELSTAESVFESMGDGYYQLDDSFRLVYMNVNAEKMLQKKRSEAIGRKLTAAFPNIAETNMYKQYERSLSEQRELFFIEYYEPLDGWYEIKVYPLKKGGLAVYFRDISKAVLTEQKLTELAYFDPLTGLPNRQKIQEVCQELMDQGKKFTIFYLNLDNMKIINSLYHYQTGDKVLKNVSMKLKQLESDNCTVGRLFGDEFLIVLEPGRKDDLAGFAEKIRALFATPLQIDDYQSFRISASVGIACFPYDTENLDELFVFAENAMTTAKQTPGFNYAFFRPQLRIAQNRRSIIEAGLRELTDETGLTYCLQPQVDGSTGQIKGVEMLARWNHRELGQISPVEFISVAEQTGTIAPLTVYLLKNLFGQVNEWQQEYEWDLTLAINISPALLESRIFFENFFALMEEHGIPAEWLELEVTEQVELTYSKQVLQNLQYCQSKGICVAIDDFGTGFSMLSYLTNFPIDKIKIDKFFVQQIGEDKKAEALLASIISLALSIDCDVLAEGVERQKEVDFLLANNCKLFQGYFYDKPMPPRMFEKKYLKGAEPLLKN